MLVCLWHAHNLLTRHTLLTLEFIDTNELVETLGTYSTYTSTKFLFFKCYTKTYVAQALTN